MPRLSTDRIRLLFMPGGIVITAGLAFALSAYAQASAVPSAIRAAALASVNTGSYGAPLRDPTDELAMLAEDPVARAIRAELAAHRLTGNRPAPAEAVEPGETGLDPVIAAKLASAFASLDGGRAAPRRFPSFSYARLAHTEQRQTRRGAGPSAEVRRAIAHASRVTGVSHDYLWKSAYRESAFDPSARAGTSSALGLYQFLNETWLAAVRTHGAKHGLGREARMIRVRPDGTHTITDPAERRRVLALRHDPALAAVLAAEFTRDNANHIQRHLGRGPSHGELYMAHFLGAGGATKMLAAARRQPHQSAAALFPAAARANRSIFYAQGRPRTVQGVAQLLKNKGEYL